MLEGWALLAVLLIVAMLGLLGGAALGFYSASTDLEREKAKAWSRGRRDALLDARVGDYPLFFDRPNPYEDEPTPAARAIELRGD